MTHAKYHASGLPRGCCLATVSTPAGSAAAHDGPPTATQRPTRNRSRR
jgi:hypothetical protein